MELPSKDKYFIDIAIAVSKRANCVGRKVGAVIILNERIISTGYNGTPENVQNCLDGGCYRCKHRGEKFAPGKGYDVCICLHAEQNAILTAARFGIAIEGASLYTTDQPCFGCTKELLQAGIQDVCYLNPWDAPPEIPQAELDGLQERFLAGIRQFVYQDVPPTPSLKVERISVIEEESK
jgi:dCMP deaminase